MVQAVTNRFLDAYTRRCGDALLRQCEPVVDLPFGKVLYDDVVSPRFVHFITSGMASLVTTMQSGSAVEIGMVGFDGFPETTPLLGPLGGAKRCIMQIAGSGLRIGMDRFREWFHRDEVLRDLVLQFVQFESLSTGQIAACNGLHDMEERLARWLLMVQDRVQSPDLPLTQEFLGEMLGSRRSTVTLIAGNLQRAGIIEYRRGAIRIKDRESLEDVACECYGVLSAMRLRLFED